MRFYSAVQRAMVPHSRHAAVVAAADRRRRHRIRHTATVGPDCLWALIVIQPRTAVLLHCTQIYLGSAMIIVLADGADARRVLGRELHRHSGVVLTTGKDDWDFLKDGLVGAK
jgi:hypothetical protein